MAISFLLSRFRISTRPLAAAILLLSVAGPACAPLPAEQGPPGGRVHDLAPDTKAEAPAEATSPQILELADHAIAELNEQEAVNYNLIGIARSGKFADPASNRNLRYRGRHLLSRAGTFNPGKDKISSHIADDSDPENELRESALVPRKITTQVPVALKIGHDGRMLGQSDFSYYVSEFAVENHRLRYTPVWSKDAIEDERGHFLDLYTAITGGTPIETPQGRRVVKSRLPDGETDVLAWTATFDEDGIEVNYLFESGDNGHTLLSLRYLPARR